MKKVFILIFVTLFIFLVFFIAKPKNNEVKYLKETDNEKHTDRIPVLTFHRLVPDDVKKEIYPDNQWVGSIDVFEEMIKYLYDNGYKTISTEEFYEWYIGNVEYDDENHIFSGSVVNTRTVITFQGTSVDEIEHDILEHPLAHLAVGK